MRKKLSGILFQLSQEDLASIAEMTEGWSGSDLHSLVHEASMAPIRGLNVSLLCDRLKEQTEHVVRAVTIEDFQVAYSTLLSIPEEA